MSSQPARTSCESDANALAEAPQVLRDVLLDLGHAEDSILYRCVDIRTRHGRSVRYLARVETPLRVDYGRVQPSMQLAKQSAALSAVLHLCREQQFSTAFAAGDGSVTPRFPGPMSDEEQVDRVLMVYTPRTRSDLKPRLLRSLSFDVLR